MSAAAQEAARMAQEDEAQAAAARVAQEAARKAQEAEREREAARVAEKKAANEAGR
jgi:hypothetical protein